ncbi:MAG: DUF4350 domain-containing protein [Spirochaetota bacterium]
MLSLTFVKSKYQILLLLLLYLLSVCFCQKIKPAKAIKVNWELVYEEGHQNVWGIWDTGYYGYSEFALTLKKRGIIVSLNTNPLNTLIAQWRDSQVSKKIIVLNVAKYQKYTSEEIDSLIKFVSQGGKLLAFGEHDNMYGIADFQNPLLKKFDISLNSDFAGDPFLLERKATSKTFHLYNIFEQLSASLNFSPKDGIVLLTSNDNPKKVLAVGKRYKKGSIVALGDSELFWNGDATEGIGRGDNRLFLVKIFEWLCQEPFPEVAQDFAYVPAKQISSRTKTVFIDTTSGGRNIDSSHSGLSKFAEYLTDSEIHIHSNPKFQYDVRIVVGALTKISYSNQRTILFMEAFDRLEAFSFWDAFQLKNKKRNLTSVYSEFEKKFHFKVQPCFLTKKTSSNYFQYLTPQNILLHRAGIIQLKDTNMSEWNLHIDKHTWCETKHPGMTEKATEVPVFDRYDVRSTLVAAHDKNLFLLADSDVISNSNSHKAYFQHFVQKIVAWIHEDFQKIN